MRDVIQKIISVENEANVTIQDARAEAERITSDARKKGNDLIENARQEALTEAKKIIDALIDLPFALPTAVAGITLTALYAGNGWFGQFLEPLGIKVAYTPIGVFVALTFIGLPFVVRTVQPVLEDIETELEEAAAMLGRSEERRVGKEC